MSLGHSIEEVVEHLCHKSFFADFTVRSPKYRKSSSLEKEAADLLVVFEETLLAVQVKSKKVDTSHESPPIVLKRVSSAIDEAIQQFKALVEALNNPHFTSFTNGRGVEIAFDKSHITNFVFIVIFVPLWQPSADSPKIRFSQTCYSDGAIPIHLFSLAQFSTLLRLLDTLPDFLLYLDARWALHRERLIRPDTDPVDEWAFITFESRKLVSILESRAVTDLSDVHERHIPSIKELEGREKPSYFVDNLIEMLHASVGTKLPIDSKLNFLDEPNSLKAYQKLIPYLARLKRKERSRFVEFLIKKVQECENQEMAFRGIKNSETDDLAYFILVAKMDREQRRVALLNLLSAAAPKLNAKRIIGLTVSQEWPTCLDCDLAFLDLTEVNPSKVFIEMGQELFGKIHTASFS